MYSIISPTKSQVYYNTGKLSPAQIKAKTGCTHIMNGWVFNFSTFKPCNWLIVNGKTIVSDAYHDYCIACDDTGAPSMTTDRNHRYVLAGSPLLKGGAKLTRNLTPDVARSAARTAIGWLKDGRLLLWCDKASMTVPQLKTKFLALGCVDALLMDGGGSTQGIFDTRTVSSSRKVATLLLFWDSTVSSTASVCPYAETTKKWVQWALNKAGYTLVIDGIFGAKTIAAIKDFQKKQKLVVDGVAGSKTKAALKKVIV